jgi:hypothetical protein
METPEIVRTLSIQHNTFPKEAVQAAIEKKEEMIPELIGMLQYIINNEDEDIDSTYWGHMFAVYLLAQFRAKEAYPLVIELLELPESRLELLFGDFGGLDSVMASVSCGDMSLIKQLIENRNADDYIRCSSQDALVTLYVKDLVSREDLIRYYKELFEGRLEKEPTVVWDILVDYCLMIHADELIDQIMDAFDAGLVWEGSISKADVLKAFAIDKEIAIEKLKNNCSYHLIDDVIEEMSSWDCFNEDNLNEDEIADQLLENASKLISEEDVQKFKKRKEKYYYDPPPSEPIRTEPKIGRNQPCPCGSGKKYKKCCGKRE